MSKKVQYHWHEDFVEVRTIHQHSILDQRHFKPGRDDDAFFEYVVEQLGFKFDNYLKNKKIDWQ